MLQLCFVSWWSYVHEIIAASSNLNPVLPVIKTVCIDPLHFNVFLVTALSMGLPRRRSSRACSPPLRFRSFDRKG